MSQHDADSVITLKRPPSTETICARFDLPAPAKALLHEGISAREFLFALMQARLYLTGIDFVAYAMRARDAVWWGALCLQHAFAGALDTADDAAVRAAMRWVLTPSEAHRVAAYVPGEAAGMGSVAGQLAMAASRSEGRLPPPAPPMTPPPFSAARCVSHAIRLATLKAPPARIQDTQRLYAALGLSVAAGRVPIPDVAALQPSRRA